MRRVAVISGGGTGIGAATADALAASCSTLVLLGRRMDRLEGVAARLASESTKVFVRSVDVSSVAAVASFADWARDELGTIDIVVNNAGSPQPRIEGGLESVAAAWETTWRANTLSAVLLTEALKPLLSRPGGRIVLVGSAASEYGTGSPAYSSAKAALQGYCLALMRELGSEGIAANVVAPGYTGGTELLDGRLTPERHARLITSIAAGRAATPQEIAALIAFLSSPDAGFINGQLVLANGGTYLCS